MELIARLDEPDALIASKGGRIVGKDDQRHALGGSLLERAGEEHAQEHRPQASLPLIGSNHDVTEPKMTRPAAHRIQFAIGLGRRVILPRQDEGFTALSFPRQDLRRGEGRRRVGGEPAQFAGRRPTGD